MKQAALDWLTKNHEDIVRGLADLVAIPSISTDGEHSAGDRPHRQAHLRPDARRPGCTTSRSCRSAARCPTPTASGSKPPASRPSSSTPTTTCSRSTSSSSGRATRGS